MASGDKEVWLEMAKAYSGRKILSEIELPEVVLYKSMNFDESDDT